MALLGGKVRMTVIRGPEQGLVIPNPAAGPLRRTSERLQKGSEAGTETPAGQMNSDKGFTGAAPGAGADI